MFTPYNYFFSVLSLLYFTIGILSLLVHGKQNIPNTTQSPIHRQNTKRIYPKRAIPGYLQNPITKVQPESNFGSTLNFLSETQFDVYVEARKEDCYYYYVMAGSTFYVAAQVLKGGDGSIGLGVKQPNGDVVLPYSWSPVAEYSEKKAQEGYYAVCLDNIFMSSGSTLVKLYISRLHSENVETIKDILTDLQTTTGNATQVVKGVAREVQLMRKFQQISRGYVKIDYKLLLDNFNYITRKSFLQVILIVACGAFQIFFVRKLFESTTSNMRAKC